ncbi:MAG TPA: insulinase family protein [Kofleriaceae bacterium]|nr:insulinase family protein [Kofleriaceae bacterium]
MLKRGSWLAIVVAVACGSPQAKPRPPVAPPVTAETSEAGTAKPVEAKPATDPSQDKLPLWPAVKRGVLPNGLTYYVLRNPKPAKRANLWLAVNAGSLQEDDDQRGLAHFVEHMAFNGTARFKEAELVNYLESIGMRFGPDLNAYTSFDQTVYQLQVPTDDAQYVDKGMQILRDWASNVTFDPKEVDKERGVVLSEWRLGRGAGQRLFDKQVKVLFEGSRYADRVTIGLPEIIKGAPRDTAVRFYKDWYRPDLMAVIAVGDFEDPAAIEKQIVATFSDLPAATKARPRPHGEVPKSTGTRVSIETDHEMTSQSVAVYNLLPHRPEATVADFRRIVVEQVYAHIFNERLRSLARKQDAPFTGASGGASGLVREIDAFTRSARVRGGKVEDALRALFAEVLRIEKHGFTQSELERARTSIARTYEQNAIEAKTADSREYTDEITRNFFEGEFMIGREAERDFTLKTLPQITLAELNQLATSYGGADNRVIVISGPDGKPLPTKDRVLAIVDEVAKRDLPPWTDKAASATLLSQTPKPGTIVKESKLDSLGVTEWQLSNGARVIVKPTDFEADNILLSGISPGGLATASGAEFKYARFADDIAAIGGVGDLDVEDLGKLLTGKQATASTSINAVTESVGGQASARDLETMFQLVYLKMTAPRKDPDAIALWKENTAESLADRQRSPDYQFNVKSSDTLWRGDPRRKDPKPADVAKVDPDKALAFYKQRFGDATDFTFTIVGAVDLAKLRPLVETYLASLPAKGRVEKEKDLGARRIAGVVKKQWNFGQETDKARVTVVFHGDETWTRDKDRDMFILGRVLSIRLREVMREDLGGVYGVAASGYLARSPHQERAFTISFGAEPKRVGELLDAADKVIAEVAEHGAKPEVLEKVKQGFIRERETQLRRNGFWLGWLESSYRYKDDPTIVLDPKPMLARITSDNVKAAAKRYLDHKRLYQAVMLPAKPAANDNKPKPAKKDDKTVPGAEKNPNDKTVPGAEKP